MGSVGSEILFRSASRIQSNFSRRATPLTKKRRMRVSRNTSAASTRGCGPLFGSSRRTECQKQNGPANHLRSSYGGREAGHYVLSRHTIEEPRVTAAFSF